MNDCDGSRPLRLTTRERQLAEAILAGRSNKAIAAHLGIREQTVRNHLSRLFRKLGVASRLELAVHLRDRRLTSE